MRAPPARYSISRFSACAYTTAAYSPNLSRISHQAPPHPLLLTHALSLSQANLLYVAVTRAKRQLFLNPKLAGQLRQFGMWDSLALQGTSLDQGLRLSPPPRCHTLGCDCSDAREMGTETPVDGGGGSDGEGGWQAPRIFYAGSGSIQPVCRACVEGVAEEEGNHSKFPYALKLSTPRGTIRGTI